MTERLTYAAIILLVGCTPMPHTKVIGPDWENYTVTEHVLGCWQMQRYCIPDIPFPIKPVLIASMGCATIDFERKTCDIYTCALSPDFALEHERTHCKGYDHGSILTDGWQEYLRGKL